MFTQHSSAGSQMFTANGYLLQAGRWRWSRFRYGQMGWGKKITMFLFNSCLWSFVNLQEHDVKLRCLVTTCWQMSHFLWGFLQRGSAIWAEESDGGKVRGEPSRDFAKVSRFKCKTCKCQESLHSNSWLCCFNMQLYELDNDPHRKEFLDELFVFMQKRGNYYMQYHVPFKSS